MNSSVLAQQVCLWFCPQDGADVGLRTVCTVLTGPGHGRPGRSAAAVLVKEVGQTHGGDQGGGQAEAAIETTLEEWLDRDRYMGFRVKMVTHKLLSVIAY